MERLLVREGGTELAMHSLMSYQFPGCEPDDELRSPEDQAFLERQLAEVLQFAEAADRSVGERPWDQSARELEQHVLYPWLAALVGPNADTPGGFDTLHHALSAPRSPLSTAPGAAPPMATAIR